jgi:hypothetical protein
MRIAHVLLIAAFRSVTADAQEPAFPPGEPPTQAAQHVGLLQWDTDTVRVPPRSSPAIMVPLTDSQRVAFYVHRTYSPRVFLRAGLGAGIAQWKHAPVEWGSGFPGYERRYAAILGTAIVRNTTEFGVSMWRHEDYRYPRSSRNGFGPRTADVIHNTIFMRTDDGSEELAWSRAATAIATGIAVNSWQPSRLRRNTLISIVGGFLGYGTSNFTSEFGPDVRKYLRRRLGRCSDDSKLKRCNRLWGRI